MAAGELSGPIGFAIAILAFAIAVVIMTRFGDW